MEFQGLPREMIDFLLEIRFHNNIAYFNENRKRYEQYVKEPLQALATALAPAVLSVDPSLDTRPVKSVSRIRRDTRFTKDKSPYRDHMWIGWRRMGEERMAGVGLYWEISPEEVHWGCGVYSDRRELMEQMRADMVEKPQKFRKVLKGLHLGEDFSLNGNEYQRLAIPETLHPDLLILYRRKGFWVNNISKPGDFDLCFTPQIVDRLAEDFRRLTPLYQLMREEDAKVCSRN